MNDQPKLFVMQLGSIVAVYVTVISLLLLSFNLIDLMIPDSLNSYWSIRDAGMDARAAIAFLLVAMPTYIILNRMVHDPKTYTAKEHYAPLMRWLIYLSLFVGSVVLLAYAVGVIMQFLNGELTLRFVSKSVVAIFLIGSTMTYYMYDAKGYWNEHKAKAQQVEYGVIGVVVAIILFSFTLIESPAAVREMSIDQQQVNDLREIEWRIEEMIQANNTVPDSIAQLYPDGLAPDAPAGREPYSVGFTDTSYALCASFAYPDPEAQDNPRPLPPRTSPGVITYQIINYGNWRYEAGRHCFERTVQFEDDTAATSSTN